MSQKPKPHPLRTKKPSLSFLEKEEQIALPPHPLQQSHSVGRVLNIAKNSENWEPNKKILSVLILGKQQQL
jgi:hypothetical protein